MTDSWRRTIEVREITPDPGQQWKLGDEFLPFHPQASHVPPDYRDGWNYCYWMAVTRAAPSSPSVQAGWMPIETAPKDGTTDGVALPAPLGWWSDELEKIYTARTYGVTDTDDQTKPPQTPGDAQQQEKP